MMPTAADIANDHHPEPGHEYDCPDCDGRYRYNGSQCCVAHAPGKCCHYAETVRRWPTRTTHGLEFRDRKTSVPPPPEDV